VLLAEAAARDLVISFTGRPHRVNDRGTQARKALLDIGFEHFLQAESKGWVLYLEGSTDLAILRAFADRTEHPARASLECPFVHYVGNRSAVARNHFHGLRDAYPDLIGLAIYDRPEQALAEDDFLPQRTWQRREIENYLCQEGTLLRFAEEKGQQQDGPVFAAEWRAKMGLSIQKIVGALDMLRDPSPWGPDLTVSDKFLPRVFEEFYDALGLPNLMSKTDFHTLAPFVSRDDLDPEIEEVLDQIHAISARANDRRADLP
jgi:hypothetical protein